VWVSLHFSPSPGAPELIPGGDAPQVAYNSCQNTGVILLLEISQFLILNLVSVGNPDIALHALNAN
jgi:hypothetical protein